MYLHLYLVVIGEYDNTAAIFLFRFSKYHHGQSFIAVFRLILLAGLSLPLLVQ